MDAAQVLAVPAVDRISCRVSALTAIDFRVLEVVDNP